MVLQISVVIAIPSDSYNKYKHSNETCNNYLSKKQCS